MRKKVKIQHEVYCVTNTGISSRLEKETPERVMQRRTTSKITEVQHEGEGWRVLNLREIAEKRPKQYKCLGKWIDIPSGISPASLINCLVR